MFSTLEEETNHFQAQGNVLICGDLNARTGLQPDFTDTQGSKYINNKLTVINNTFPHIHRNNHDHTVNKNGKDLLQLCQSLGLYIINGRLRGDTLGQKIQALIDNFLNNTYAHTNEGVNLAVKYMKYIFEKSAKLSKLKTKNGKIKYSKMTKIGLIRPAKLFTKT